MKSFLAICILAVVSAGINATEDNGRIPIEKEHYCFGVSS